MFKSNRDAITFTICLLIICIFFGVGITSCNRRLVIEEKIDMYKEQIKILKERVR